MPSYTFNPHRHVRIWLSQDSDSFLNLENQLRLVRLREINPHDEIHFIYDSSLLSDSAMYELTRFCNTHQIKIKDIQKDIIPACTTQEEHNLLSIYKDEIKHLNAGGNLAVASDILRWLGPIYTLGSYSDFDTFINTKKLPQTIQVKSPLLLNMGSTIMSVLLKKVEFPRIINDIIAVVDEDGAQEIIKKIQQAMYLDCINKNGEGLSYKRYQLKEKKDIRAALGEFRFELLEEGALMTQNYPSLFNLTELYPWLTTRELRDRILKKTADNQVFCAPQSVSDYACAVRNVISSKQGFWERLTQSKQQYRAAQEMLSLPDEELVTRMRLNARFRKLRDSVIYTTGPDQLARCILPRLIYRHGEFNEALCAHALASYSLDTAFSSKQRLALHMPIDKAEKALVGGLGQKNDFSWLQEGQQATRVREQKIKAAAATINSFFKYNQKKKHRQLPIELACLKEELQHYIDETKERLNTSFHFYRHRTRSNKLETLENIMTHFKNNQFHADEFKASLKEYQAIDVPSKIKKLIDRLIIFSKQAKAFSIASKDGIIELHSPMSV